MLYPDFDNRELIVKTSYNWSGTIHKNGYILANAMSNSGFVGIYLNGQAIAYSGSYTYSHHDWDINFIPVKKGDNIYCEIYYEPNPAQASATILFLPFKR